MSELDEFVTRYGLQDAPVIEPDPVADGWPAIIVRAGDKAAVVQFMHVAADSPDNQHLCIDVHPFVAGRKARASVFGMEAGRRLDGFNDAQAAGTSQGAPGAALAAVLVGGQRETPRPMIEWRRGDWGWTSGGYLLSVDLLDDRLTDGPRAWRLSGPLLDTPHPLFMSTDERTALRRAEAVIAAQQELAALATEMAR